MKTLITVLPINTQLSVVAWSIFRELKGGAPGGYIGRIDAPTKESAEAVAKLLYGDNVTAQAERPSCSHCGEYLPCSGATWSCILPQGDGRCPLP